MTIAKALERADQLKPNMVKRKMKIDWLSELDGLLHREIILKHEHTEEQDTFTGYNEETDQGQELLAPFPYDEIYTFWLLSKIDLNNMEYDRYSNDRILFNNAYDTLSDYWTREHMPITYAKELRI